MGALLGGFLKTILINKIVNYVGKKVAKAIGGVYVPPTDTPDLEKIIADAIGATTTVERAKSSKQCEEFLGIPFTCKR